MGSIVAQTKQYECDCSFPFIVLSFALSPIIIIDNTMRTTNVNCVHIAMGQSPDLFSSVYYLEWMHRLYNGHRHRHHHHHHHLFNTIVVPYIQLWSNGQMYTCRRTILSIRNWGRSMKSKSTSGLRFNRRIDIYNSYFDDDPKHFNDDMASFHWFSDHSILPWPTFSQPISKKEISVNELAWKPSSPFALAIFFVRSLLYVCLQCPLHITPWWMMICSNKKNNNKKKKVIYISMMFIKHLRTCYTRIAHISAHFKPIYI